jgi:hypothetical protein
LFTTLVPLKIIYYIKTIFINHGVGPPPDHPYGNPRVQPADVSRDRRQRTQRRVQTSSNRHQRPFQRLCRCVYPSNHRSTLARHPNHRERLGQDFLLHEP